MSALNDESTRLRAAKELEKSFILDAGAGTGKTTVLLSRILETILTGKSDLDHIVAITFTEKAAGELKVRLRFELEQALKQTGGAAEKRVRQAVSDIERAQVTTIHAFCAALLHERPVEAGVKPDFDVLDELGADLMIDRVWREWLATEMEKGPPPLAAMLRDGIEHEALRAPAKFLLDHRDVIDRLPSPVEENMDRLRQLFATSLVRLGQLQRSCEDAADLAHSEIELLRKHCEELSALDPNACRDYLLSRVQVRGHVGNQKNWKTKDALEETRAVLRRLQEQQADFAAACRHNLTVEIVRWLTGFIERYEKTKAESGSLDFFDLLYRCRNLLKDDKRVRGYFQQRFDLILVDEFQDTDPLQIEILFFLGEESPRADNWNTVKLRPGKLFLVGDPKQSIYSFRRADVEAYHEAKEILTLQGEALPLSLNFRSRPAVINWVNGLFSKLIQPPDEGSYQPRYQPIVSSREREQGPSVYALPLAPQISLGEKKAADLRAAEARTVAAFLRETLAQRWKVRDPRTGEQRLLRYGDVAILFRAKEAIDRYEEEFRDFDIPYRVAGGRRYYSRLEMNALLALLSAIDNPKDGVALVATLRSPFFGVSDEELFLHVQAGFPLDYSAFSSKTAQESTNQAMSTSMREAFHLLAKFHGLRNDLSTPLFLLKLYEATRILPLLYLKPQGDQKVANLLKTVDLARSLRARGVITLRSFVRFLKKMDATEAEEGESPLAEDTEDVVRFMTIHKAKGLEFPLVILGDVAYEGGSHSRTGAFNQSQGKLEIRIGPKEKGMVTTGWHDAAEKQKRREDAEGHRLLYVAVTRARDYFVLPLAHDVSTNKFLTPLWADLTIGADLPWGQEIHGHSGSAITVFDSRTLDAEKRELRPFRTRVDIREFQKKARSNLEASDAALTDYREWERRREEIREKGMPSRRIIPAGGIGKPKEEETRSYGEGAVFGTFVHEIFRALDFHGPQQIQAIAETLGRVYNLDSAAIRRGIGLVEWGLSSPVLRRAARSPSLWKEVPFVYRHREDLVEAFVDLVFEEEGELVIVDFKTDAIKDKTALEEKARHYTPQGILYAIALEAITQKKIKEVILLFLSAQTEKSVPLERATFRHTVELMEEALRMAEA